LELLCHHYNTFVTPQVFLMTAEGTVGAPTCWCKKGVSKNNKLFVR
jgi:hypothetical protein